MARSHRSKGSSGGQTAPGVAPAEKVCAACGRTMVWRKRWARTWDTVRYCSDACRRAKVTDADVALERAIVALLRGRAARSSACPSEVARLATSDDQRATSDDQRATSDGQRATSDDWCALMEPVRRAARRLAARGVIVIKQRGAVVDPSRAKGALRLARGPRFDQAAEASSVDAQRPLLDTATQRFRSPR